jgi:hypothetical protein
MLKIYLAILGVIAVTSSAFGDVTVCKLNRVQKDPMGSQKVTSCTFSIDSNDHSGNQGNGGISHNLSLGTASTDCPDLPADYDSSGMKPFQMWDQGAANASDVGSFVQFVQQMGYTQNGNLGFDLSQISSLKLAQGGESMPLSLYTAYDASGKKLGTIFFGGGNPFLSYQGCYVQ